MKSRYLPLFLGATLVPVSPATVNAAIEDIRFNEVLIDPGPEGEADDDNYEYIELASTHGGIEPTTGLTILLIDTTGGNIGSIREAWSLDGMSTGANGLLLLGNGYDSGENPHPNVPVATGLGDPAGDGLAQPRLSGLGNDDIEPNDGLTLLLVTGYSPTARIDEDLDTNDSGVFNFTRWTSIVDSVGIGDRAEPNDSYAGADLTQTGYDPDLLARKPGELAPNSTAAWFGGDILGDDNSLSVVLDPVRQFGSFPEGAATPGRPNAPFELSNLRINEVNINPPGSGAGRFQYIEIADVDGGIASGNGYHLLVVNTDNGSDPTCVAEHRTLGTIVEAWDLAPFSTGANGLMLIGDGYDLETPWDSAVESETAEADPDGFGSGDIGNRIAVKESTVCGSDRTDEGFTLLLVTGFSGAVDNDVDSDDDGVLNGTLPWDDIVDSVGYGKLNIAQTANVTATYAGADVSQVSAEGGYEPDNISRRSDDMTGNSAAAWYGGDFGGKSPSSTNFKPDSSFGGFAGRATPGAANLAAAPEPGSLVINEVNIDPPGPEGSSLNSVEFIEIANPDGLMTGGQGYHLLVVVPGGEVIEIWDLSPFNTGANGLAVFGDVDDSWAYDNVAVGVADPATTREDPDGYDNGDLPNGDFSLLLVTGFAGSLGVDLDSDNDGEFDDPLGFTIVDGLGFGASLDSDIADLSQSGFMPDNVSRVAGAFTPRTAAAWAGGELAGPEGTSVDYTGNFFGPFQSGASPGRLNHAAAPGGGTIVINEVNINPPGDDDNFEFVELVTSSLGAQSTNGLTLLVVDAYGGGDGLGNTGEILEVWSLDSLKTGTNGLLLMGDDYTLPGGNPFAAVVAPGTEIADPEGLGGTNLEPNDGLLLMLVRGFIGNRFDDLDEAPQGSFDVLPWEEIVDSIGFGTRVYGQPDAKMGFPVSATWDPDHVSRVGRIGNLTPLEIDDWFVGSLAGAAGTSTAYHVTERFDHSGLLQPSEFMATPGSHNPGGNIGDDLVDNDSDGLVNLIEDAIGSDRDTPDTEKHPTGLIVDVGGTDYQAITYTRLTGGSGTTGVDWVAGGFRYTVEASSDLETWVSGAEHVEALGAVVDNGDGTETVVVRLEQPVTAPAGANQFLRLKVTRL